MGEEKMKAVVFYMNSDMGDVFVIKNLSITSFVEQWKARGWMILDILYPEGSTFERGVPWHAVRAVQQFIEQPEEDEGGDY